MVYFEQCLGTVAPYYNLALVILVVVLFSKLFSIKNKKVFIKPWKILFSAIMVFVVEEIITVLHMSKVISVPLIIFPLLEMGIITLFIYMLLLQREYIK